MLPEATGCVAPLGDSSMTKQNIIRRRFALLAGLTVLPGAAHAFNFGDIAVLQADASANNTTFGVLEFNGVAANQGSAVNTYAISGTGVNALRISGSATSTGYLSRSNDGKLLAFTAANSTNTSANVNTLNPRGVGTLDFSGNFALATTYTGTSGNQTRSATTLNGTNWYIGDQGGLYTNGATSASPAGNFRNVHAFGGTVYGLTASASAAPVGTFTAITGGSYSGLPGLALGNSNFQDFYMIQSGSNGSAYDVLYTMSATSNTAGTINKFSLVSGNWVANGSYTTTFGGFGLAARSNAAAPGASLFVTSGQGALTANSLLRLTDTAGYNSALSISTGSNVTLFRAGTGKILKGVELSPVPEPASMAALGLGIAALLRRRKAAK
jgi:hypothetical protein